jgi:toxin ParE1/3/4
VRVLWTPRAASDLNEAVDFISVDKPDAAIRVADRIYRQVMQLGTLPYQGRIGLVPGTRELVFHPWPYIAVYKIQGDTVRIIHIRHASRQWP